MAFIFKRFSLFPTFVHMTFLEHIDHQAIADLIFQLEKEGQVQQAPGAIGGIQTMGNILAHPHPEIVKLNRMWVEIVSQIYENRAKVLETLGWAVIARSKDMSLPIDHNHLPWHMSGVYYPQVPVFEGGDPTKDGGNLAFVDPRWQMEAAQKQSMRPETGMLVVFPSWLCHTVIPFEQSAGDRISISVNANISPTSVWPPIPIAPRIDWTMGGRTIAPPPGAPQDVVVPPSSIAPPGSYPPNAPGTASPARPELRRMPKNPPQPPEPQLLY